MGRPKQPALKTDARKDQACGALLRALSFWQRSLPSDAWWRDVMPPRARFPASRPPGAPASQPRPSASSSPSPSPSPSASSSPSPSVSSSPSVTATPTSQPSATSSASTPAATTQPSSSPTAGSGSGSGLIWLWVLLGVIILIGVIVGIVRARGRRSAAAGSWRSSVVDAYAKGSALHDAMSVAETPGALGAYDAGARWSDIQRRADDLTQTLYALREAAPDDEAARGWPTCLCRCRLSAPPWTPSVLLGGLARSKPR